MENEFHAGAEIAMTWFSAMFLGRISARILKKWERNMELQREVNMFALYDYYRRFPASVPREEEKVEKQGKVVELHVVKGGKSHEQTLQERRG